MATKQLNYIVEDPEQGADFPAFPPDHKFVRTPEELMELMARAGYEFEYANRQMRSLEATRTIKRKQIMIILLSKRTDLIKTENLRKHLDLCLEDPKFKFTSEILESFIYIELKDIEMVYERYESIAKQAEKEHDMWKWQLSWYQAVMKKEIEEARAFGRNEPGA